MEKIRFQLDAHVPHAIARALRRRGIDVLAAVEAGLRTSPDTTLLAHACSQGRVMVTQDSDFLVLDHQGVPHAGIAYCEQGARTLSQMIEGLVLIYEVLDTDDMVGHVEYL